MFSNRYVIHWAYKDGVDIIICFGLRNKKTVRVYARQWNLKKKLNRYVFDVVSLRSLGKSSEPLPVDTTLEDYAKTYYQNWSRSNVGSLRTGYYV